MIHTNLIATIPDLLARHAAQRGSQVAYRDHKSSVTYAALADRTARLAGHLADLGVKPGEKVAIFLPNSVEWVESCFAINRAEAISVPISHDATESEVLYRLQDAGCTAIVTTDDRSEFVATLKEQAPNLRAVVLVGPGEAIGNAVRYSDLATTAPKSVPRDGMEIREPAFIIYTSGTTGRAKGVLLSVHSMLWVVAACWAPIAQLSGADVVLSPLPLYHSYALNLSVLGILATGATEHIMEKFSVKEAIRLLKSGEFTVLPGVPTMFHYLLEATRDDPSATFPSLRVSMSAGAILPAALNREFEERFGIKLLDGYGITETSTMVTMNGLDGVRVMGSCGLPLQGVAVRIVSPASGLDVAVGEEGELIVRGPNLMSGYHNKQEETASALRNGWYHTGDLARSDINGFLTITGRLKELIIRGGQNIAPAEIEEVVDAFEGVVECAVVGVPHDLLGEVPALFVVPRANTQLVGTAILDHCKIHLSSYKVPASIHFVTEIPRTGSGKIIRFKLRESLAAPIDKAS
jgi:acyl-CoA synthetase (AMP-forming)/AMP-acid ligase II